MKIRTNKLTVLVKGFNSKIYTVNLSKDESKYIASVIAELHNGVIKVNKETIDYIKII